MRAACLFIRWIPPPPRSTLFPYTTLFRSVRPRGRGPPWTPRRLPAYGRRGGPLRRRSGTRSEEHTSELQSHSDLVCRLLLEKKNDFYIALGQAKISPKTAVNKVMQRLKPR